MGNCRDKRNLATDLGTNKIQNFGPDTPWELESRCKKFETDIKACIIEREGY